MTLSFARKRYVVGWYVVEMRKPWTSIIMYHLEDTGATLALSYLESHCTVKYATSVIRGGVVLVAVSVFHLQPKKGKRPFSNKIDSTQSQMLHTTQTKANFVLAGRLNLFNAKQGADNVSDVEYRLSSSK